MPRAEPKSTPLTAQRRQRAPREMHPMKAHAMMWRHVSGMDQDELAKQGDRINYGLPVLGELAGNPKVTAKDVIKASSQAAADGKMTPEEAVQFISRMPEDPDKLQSWLRTLYAANMSAAVHIKAAQMRTGTGAAPVAAPSGPATPPQDGTPPPTSMTPGVAT